MSKLALFVFVLFAVVAVSVTVHQQIYDVDVDAIASWALDEIGPGHSLIKVKKVKKERVNGVLYNLKLKVRKFTLGGSSRKVTCKVKILVYENVKHLTYHRCFKSGSGLESDLVDRPIDLQHTALTPRLG